jgi:tRNA threonylcarbamoyladenosine biosynthesis protein TsaB
VLADDELLALVPGDPGRTHGERLPAELEAALAAAKVGLGAIDVLAVAVGPGAFTGLRIGIAAMQGLSMSAGLPVAGVSALDAMALAAFAGSDGTAAASVFVGCLMDAQRGECFGALFAPAPDAGWPHSPTALPFTTVAPAAVAAESRMLDSWRPLHAAHALQLVRADAALPPLAPCIARLARRAAARGEAGPPHQLQPLYVRRPDAEIERDRRAGQPL